jgi:hypothetical protein
MLKHYNWSTERGGGRIAVLVEGNRFRLEQLSGIAPTSPVIFAVLEQLPDVLDRGNELHQRRTNRYTTERRTGMSGCVDYLLHVERDPELHDYPITAGIHVSMYGKLNEGVDLWLMDLIPLIIEMLNDYPTNASDEVWLKEVKIRQDFDWEHRSEFGLEIISDGHLSVEPIGVSNYTDLIDQQLELDDIEDYVSAATIKRLKELSAQ